MPREATGGGSGGPSQRVGGARPATVGVNQGLPTAPLVTLQIGSDLQSGLGTLPVHSFCAPSL